MTATQAGTWVMPEGWTTTHLLRPDIAPPVTVCGRQVHPLRALWPEISTGERCGQCLRRVAS